MRILLVGDSHMQALGPRLGELLDPYGIESIGGLAQPGKSTRWYSEQQLVAEAVRAHRPDAVVFVLGGNDQCWGAARQAEYWSELLAQARAASSVAKVVVAGPPMALDGEVDRRHACSTAATRAFAQARGLPFIDTREVTPEGKYRADRVHFTADGYDEMALGLAPRIARALEGAQSLLPGIVLGGLSLVLALGIFWAVAR